MTVRDPQQHEDTVVRRWRHWAATATAQATVLRTYGEYFDARLKQARAEIRRAAAEVLKSASDPETAAALMMRQAVEASVRVPPIIGYDEAAIRYTAARTWQACAREIDPDLPEAQPRWP
jgi:hypothetical protein